MTSREIIRRLVAHDAPPRLGCAFGEPWPSDIVFVARCGFVADRAKEHLSRFGDHPELRALVPGFKGELMRNPIGNIFGRFAGKTQGECVRGALRDWDSLEDFSFPALTFPEGSYQDCEKYVVASAPLSVFSTLRDTRLIANALMDVALEPENIKAFLARVCAVLAQAIDHYASQGADAMMMADDWGTQDRTFISPAAFDEIFLPAYRFLTDRLHERGMHFILHSCGYNQAFMESFLAAGVDVLQFDQLGLYGYERMAGAYSRDVTFFSPLDIQKTLPTGNRTLIESEALRMATAFRQQGGGLIIGDYGSYKDIDVKEEWAGWARNVFLANLSL